MTNSRFKLWDEIETMPTARMLVHGIGAAPMLEVCRTILCQRKFGLKYHDAKVQWTDILAQQGSLWNVWILNRGKGIYGTWTNQLLEFVIDDPGRFIPGVRENLGLQIVLLLTRKVEFNITDFVISLEQRRGGVSQKVFAEKALECITADLEPKGIAFEHLRAVRTKDLEESCPAHRVTRIVLEKAVRKQGGTKR